MTNILIGTPISPYVRKILAVCAVKGVEVTVDPITSFVSSAAFDTLNPLRRIPVWIDDDVTLCDSSVILEYLEDRWPDPGIWPKGPVARARARWLEEYADTRLADVLLRHIFFERLVRPNVLGEETDAEVARHGCEVLAPEVFDYLEAQLPEDGFLFGAVSAADFSLAPSFLNARAARFKPSPDRWPRLVAWLDRMETETPLGPLNQIARALLGTPLAGHRDKIAELGLTPSARTWAGTEARRGPMSGR